MGLSPLNGDKRGDFVHSMSNIKNPEHGDLYYVADLDTCVEYDNGSQKYEVKGKASHEGASKMDLPSSNLFTDGTEIEMRDTDTLVKSQAVNWVDSGTTSSANTSVSDTAPSNPSKGDEWVDTSFRTPERKVYDGGTWLATTKGTNVPDKQTYTTGTHEIDVSDITQIVTVIVSGEPGEWSTKGGHIIADVNLTEYNTLTVHAGSYQQGESGEGYEPSGGDYFYDEAGDGGNSSGIVADGNLILAAGGGGGDPEPVDGWSDYYLGGDGGGPNGGRGGTDPDYNRATNGGTYRDNNADITVQNTSTSNEPKVQLFINSNGLR